MDVIFLDFQKAFDKVPKKRLLQKLSAYGIEEANIQNGLMLSAGFRKGLYWDRSCF